MEREIRGKLEILSVEKKVRYSAEEEGRKEAAVGEVQ